MQCVRLYNGKKGDVLGSEKLDTGQSSAAPSSRLWLLLCLGSTETLNMRLNDFAHNWLKCIQFWVASFQFCSLYSYEEYPFLFSNMSKPSSHLWLLLCLCSRETLNKRLKDFAHNWLKYIRFWVASFWLCHTFSVSMLWIHFLIGAFQITYFILILI